jgi:hypothetical protein
MNPPRHFFAVTTVTTVTAITTVIAVASLAACSTVMPTARSGFLSDYTAPAEIAVRKAATDFAPLLQAASEAQKKTALR